jgi:hypothetical protein
LHLARDALHKSPIKQVPSGRPIARAALFSSPLSNLARLRSPLAVTLGLVPTTAGVRMPAAWVGMSATARVSAARYLRMTTCTGVRVTAADIATGMRSASAGAAVRCAATGVTLMAVIARYRGMSATRGAVILAARTTMTSGARTAVILRSMSARATIMRYLVANRATVRATGSMRTNNTPSRKLARSRSRRHRRSSVIERRSQLSIACSGVLMITLQRRGFEVMLMFRCHLMRGGMRLYAARPVERHMDVVVYDSVVIYVGDMNTAHVHNRSVVEVSTTTPVTALESNTAIAEAVIHTAVKADMRTPVTTVPGVNTAAPTPISGRPQQAGGRRQHPGARYPEVPVITVGPITRRPHIAGRRQRRLHIHREDRRCNVDRHAYRNTGVRNRGEHGKRGE